MTELFKPLRLLTDAHLSSGDDQQWAVKNVIPATGVGTVFGDSGTFKSFIVLDLMAHVAHGWDWFGRKTVKMKCVYMPFEGKGGVPKRVQAWKLAMAWRLSEKNPDGWRSWFLSDFPTGINFIMDPVNLREPVDRQRLIDLLLVNGCAGCLLVIDTLAAAGGSIDESSSKDMGELIAIFQDLQLKLGGVVLVIHHTGKDQSRGMRGWSGLRGAIDFAIACEKEEGARYNAAMRLDKVKDEEAGGLIPFQMERIPIGVDDDGEIKTSLVVMPPAQDAPPPLDEVAENDADDAFIWEWVKRREGMGEQPSQNSLLAQSAEMAKERQITHACIRASVARLKATGRMVSQKPLGGGQAYLHATSKVT